MHHQVAGILRTHLLDFLHLSSTTSQKINAPTLKSIQDTRNDIIQRLLNSYNNLIKKRQGDVLSKNGGANSNQTHLGPPEDSSRSNSLLEEATLLAWAS